MATMKHAPHPVTHAWHVSGLHDPDACAKLTDWLEKTDGIQYFQLDTVHDKVAVTYDLCQITCEEIEAAFAASQLTPQAGLLPAVERGWIHYTEKNERDSLTFTPRSFTSVDHVH